MSALNNSALIGASGSTGYQISRSVRLRQSASGYFARTPSSNGSRTTWTWSGWVKRGALGNGALFTAGLISGTFYYTTIGFGDQLVFTNYNDTNAGWLTTTQVFRDPSAWYHIVAVFDSTNATDTERMRLYVNGSRITAFSAGTFPTTYPPLNATSQMNTTAYTAWLGSYVRNGGSGVMFDGYLAEVNFIDGQALTPASFGETNPITGVWQPKKYAGTYGTNGFYLNFSDNSGVTATTIGKDYSGNGNNWTPNNISVTAGVTYDSMLDVPTQWADGGNGRGNYAVSNPINAASGLTVSDGNLKIAASAGGSKFVNSSISFPSSGAYYAEITFANASTNLIGQTIGIALGSRSLTAAYNAAGSYHFYASNTGSLLSNGTETSGLSAISANEVFQVAVDVTNSKMWIGRSNVWYNSTGGTTGNPSTGANPTFTAAFVDFFVFAGFDTGSSVSANLNFGQRPFAYTPPTGFKALNTLNLPTPTILKGELYMNATLWSGDSVNARVITTSLTAVDFAWVKKRNGIDDHRLANTVTGGNRHLQSNTTAAESTGTTVIQAFSGSTFTLGTDNSVNATGGTYVGWTWRAGAGSSSSNTAGSVTSTVSVNPTAGISVLTYTESGTYTVGHGLGVAPSMIILKERNAVGNWIAWTNYWPAPTTRGLYLNGTSAAFTTGANWLNSATSTVFGITGGQVTSGSSQIVAYVFAEIAGFSRFGTYTGNGSADGPFVFTGFRPRYVLIKCSSAAGTGWYVYDTVRNTYNVMDLYLRPDVSDAETTFTTLDCLSNGFKLRTTNSQFNGSGSTYIFAAFAENPFKNALAR